MLKPFAGFAPQFHFGNLWITDQDHKAWLSLKIPNVDLVKLPITMITVIPTHQLEDQYYYLK